ncbi:MAG: tRNA uridine-5-carboxymethylaminomethyl(34) synthesis GTPase MnmE [Acidobacteriia bacterium]|nr:tRNA uridine-5-carboxymethylaminomethyl(34) synthesis GTPase MnmE [Terriglobia bacterium]
MLAHDTIVAISTPPGRSGIGVIRLSGDNALAVARNLMAAKGSPESVAALSPRYAERIDLVDPSSGALIDEVVVTFFKGPKSYTGEDVVEISCHGSPVVLHHVVQLAMAEGARIAEPGEFTLRAFLNGHIDLVQAEAIQDLIDARTFYQAQVAIQQAHGLLSKTLGPLKDHLIDLISLLEAGIDFAEDDVPVLADEAIKSRLQVLQGELDPILQSFSAGRIIRDGLTLAIIGRPNVGKSSLFNRLLSSERAIVTEIPGTTRDLISEMAQIHGLPVRLMDTAGIRESMDRVEREGVARSYAALAESDLVLLVLDASGRWDPGEGDLVREVRPLKHVIVLNKCDLGVRIEPSRPEFLGRRVLSVSAKTGDGIESLQGVIFEMATGRSVGNVLPQSVVTNLRHHQLLSECEAKLGEARQGVDAKDPHEVILLALYGALKSLDTITGATTAEDILGNIFSRFCVGK